MFADVRESMRLFSLRKTFAELLGRRWMEPAIPAVLLVLLVSYFSVAASGFATSSNALSTAETLAAFSMVALGMGLTVIGGGIDLSVGAIYSLSNMLMVFLVLGWGVPATLAMFIVVAVGALIGVVNGIFVAYFNVLALLVTLVMLTIVDAVVNIMSTNAPSGVITNRSEDPLWVWLGNGTAAGLPAAVFVALVVYLIAQIVMTRSRYGAHVVAIGANRRAARHAGINVARTRFATYVVSGAVAGLGGVFTAAQYHAASTAVGSGLEIPVATAVILGGISLAGGRGTPVRALIGAATVQVLNQGLALMNLPGATYTTVLAVVLIVAVGADTKWAKNRGKVIQKTYVNPAPLEYGPLADVSPDAGGPLAQNERLREATAIGLGEVEGPEDVILDRAGNLYCGDRRGWVHRFSGEDFSEHEVFARPGGLPLGMALDDQGNIVICVGGMGLYSMAPDGSVNKLTDETNRTWYTIQDDSRLRLADDCDITPEGVIYFSEASIRFEFDEVALDVLEGRPNGRVIRYDPRDGSTKTVVKKIRFPNGICSSHDGKSILINSTGECRIYRYWHSGEKEGTLEVFSDAFPGYLDNINRASDGGYWVALNGMRSPVLDLAMTMPGFRRRMLKRVPPDEWLFPSINYGCVIKVSAEGELVDSYWDPGGHAHATITSMREHDGHLYIGGLTNNRVGKIQLPPNEHTCTCGQIPCATAKSVSDEGVASVVGAVR
jgi:ribose transport system permease protein